MKILKLFYSSHPILSGMFYFLRQPWFIDSNLLFKLAPELHLVENNAFPVILQLFIFV